MKTIYNKLKTKAEHHNADFVRPELKDNNIILIISGTDFEDNYIEITFSSKGNNYYYTTNTNGKITPNGYTFKKVLISSEIDRSIEDVEFKIIENITLNRKVFDAV